MNQQQYLKNCPPFYETYIKLVEGDVFEALERQLLEIEDFFMNIPLEKQNYAYAEGKWTIKQLISHLIDTEKIMCYRALRFSRNDTTMLAGYDENSYVENTNLSKVTYNELVNEFLAVRKANLYFFKSLIDSDLMKNGNANNNNLTVGMLLYIIVGHILHHIKVIKERYL